jgi:hypothetical protein
MLGQALDFVPYQAKAPPYSPQSDRKRMNKRGKAQCPYKTAEKRIGVRIAMNRNHTSATWRGKLFWGRHDLSRKARWPRGSYRVGCPCSSKAAIGSHPWFWGPFRSLGWGSSTGDRLDDLNARDVERDLRSRVIQMQNRFHDYWPQDARTDEYILRPFRVEEDLRKAEN